MRLGQLARKLAVRPDEIVAFLAEKNIEIEESSNIKLEDGQVTLIMKQFGPAILEKVVPQILKEEIEVFELPAIVEPSISEPINNHEEHVIKEIGRNELESPIQIIEEKEAVIKAPKIALSGLKVVGKIEIQEPKKKEPKPEKEVMPLAGAKTESRKTYIDNRVRIEQRPKKNPIAMARELEAMEAEKQKIANAEREKEKRTQNYLKKVKLSPPTKAARLVSEPVTEMSEADLVDMPKTLLGKFLKWLKS